MSGLWKDNKFGFCENKQTTKSVQCSKGASMTTQWTRGVGNQAQGKKKKDIGRFKLSLDRGINSTHKSLCTRNAVCMHDRACNL